MLLAAAILAFLLALVIGTISAFASGMSDAPGRTTFWGTFWPAILLAFVGVVCLIARHFLHGAAITW